MEELREREGSRDRELDLLRFEIEEIESVGPSEAEETALQAERERLAPARRADGRRRGRRRGDGARERRGRRRRDAGRGRAAGGRGGGRGPGARRARGQARHAADRGRGPGRRAAPLRVDRSRPSRDGSRRWRGGSTSTTGCARKHGGSVAAVLAHAEECIAKRDELESVEVELERAEAELAEAHAERDRLAAELTAARGEAAPRLAERVREELESLAMEGAEFEVVLEMRDGDRRHRGRAGGARCWRPNPGVPAAPLREAASGGELSRVMLALMTVAGGRRVAHARVRRGGRGRGRPDRARRRRAPARPRAAPPGALHHPPAPGRGPGRVATSASRRRSDASPRSPRSSALEGDDVVEELCRMLGAGASRRRPPAKHAREPRWRRHEGCQRASRAPGASAGRGR